MAAVQDQLLMARRDVECPVQFIQTKHGTFAYHVEGPEGAPTVVMLHGSMMSRKQWIFPTPPKDVRIVAVTRPGYDDSDDIDPRKFEYSMIADIVKDILDKLGIKEFHVVGHSGGGPPAIAVKACLHPQCKRCIVLAGESEYKTKPAVDPVGMKCMGPNGCCGKCGCALNCALPIGMKCMMGSCCSCKTTYTPADLKKQVPENTKYNLPGDLALQGEHGEEYGAFAMKTIEDAMRGGLKRNGAILDFWATKKGFDFIGKLGQSCEFGSDVEMWTGDKDTTVPLKVAEHNKSLMPGSTVNAVKDVGHTGVGFPVFVAERFASLLGENAPQQVKMTE